MADPLATVEKIVKVALAIKEAVRAVRKNKEQCCEIRKRVLRVSALLKRLQETEMIQDPAMRDALEALEETLTHTHELIVACQKKNIMCHFCLAGDLAKQLREVKQDISDQMVDGIFAVNVNATIILKSIQYVAACSLPPKNTGVVENSHYCHSTYEDRYKCGLLNHSENNLPVRNLSQSPPFSWLTKFSLSELETATNGFSDENIIGRGGFVSVYKVLENPYAWLSTFIFNLFWTFHMTIVINGVVSNRANDLFPGMASLLPAKRLSNWDNNC